MERKARKLHWKKKQQLDMSLERLKKKNISSFAAGGDEKKTYPAGAPETNPYFFFGLRQKNYCCNINGVAKD